MNMSEIEPQDVVVIGSCMIDLVCFTDRLPKPGETIHGNDFSFGHGGKGANQCVAAARLGATTALIARLGSDTFGAEYKEHLLKENVNIKGVTLTEGATSGMAQITVSKQGENQIVIVSGANKFLSLTDVENSKDLVLNAKVVLFQFETPLETTLSALEYIKQKSKNGVTVITNAAPALKNIDPKLFSLSDIFCVNETEAEEMCGFGVGSVAEGEAAVKHLAGLGCKTVIITMGAQGVVFSEDGHTVKHVPIQPVQVVDTTGAGDAFLGALGFYTARYPQTTLQERIRRACLVASVSVTQPGTQASYPRRQSLPPGLFSSTS